MLSNVFTNPRTTLAGLLAVVLSQVGAYVVPAIVTYLGGQPGLGWQVAGLVLGLVAPALMRDRKAQPGPSLMSIPPPNPPGSLGSGL